MASIKIEMRNSFFWNAVDNFSRMGVQFVIGVILARLLDASDYGILGIISVFIAISQTFIDAGFSNALIQKKDCTNIDFSTVFWINLFISLFVFIILYITAPYVANFYEVPILSDVLKVMGGALVLQSIYTVNKVKLTKELKFKQLAFIAFITSTLSGIIAIALAYMHFGVWSLVFQTVISIILSGFIIVYLSKWRPQFIFSKTSFKGLFDFGSKLLVSNILYTIFNNLYNLIIGKCFQPATLGYFTRADGYAKLVPNNVSGILQNIMLPVLSKLQDDIDGLVRIYEKFIKLTSFFIYPMTLLFAVLAKPIIILMLTDKWADSVPLLQILCIASLFDHIMSINNNYLMVRGKSDYILKLSASTKVIMILVILLSFKFGIIAVAYSKLVYAIVCVVISSYYLNKAISIRITRILAISKPIMSVSLAVAGFAYMLNYFLPMAWWSLILIIISSMFLYFIGSKIFLKDELELVKSVTR